MGCRCVGGGGFGNGDWGGTLDVDEAIGARGSTYGG